MVKLFNIDYVSSTAQRIFTGITEFVKKNPLLAGAGIGVGSSLTAFGLVKGFTRRSPAKKKRTTKRKTTRKRKTRKRKRTKRRRFRKPYKYARTAGKGKDRSTRRIRMTKHGQPYIILASGKAKFISKKSARISRRRKGGRY